ncbi:potassium-transporting ATPase subunit F [Streptomyces sp. NPDC058545]|uniref:potassium-transporting ATPase subunit F n=1 Tax=Streptomyces sp. NPDC058545 TaxID=3346544 RepID=UPI00366943AF
MAPHLHPATVEVRRLAARRARPPPCRRPRRTHATGLSHRLGPRPRLLRPFLRPVHSFSTGWAGAFTALLPGMESRCIRGRYLGCDRNRRFLGRNARPDLVLGASVSTTDVLLLVLSFVTFIYLGVALFKAERF